MGKRRREERDLQRQAKKEETKKRKKDTAGHGQKEASKAADPQESSHADAVIDRARLEQTSKTAGKEEKRLIVVLEDAPLETVKSGKGFGLLNVDEHAHILRKVGREFTSARPDITHQCLLMLLFVGMATLFVLSFSQLHALQFLQESSL